MEAGVRRFHFQMEECILCMQRTVDAIESRMFDGRRFGECRFPGSRLRKCPEAFSNAIVWLGQCPLPCQVGAI
jgi:hypothetical protein